MLSWLKRVGRRPARGEETVGARQGLGRLTLESLEDRVTPADLGTPTILDPAAAVRVDQGSYTLSGTLSEAAKNGTSLLAYRDSNLNGVFDAGTDALAASAALAFASAS